MYMYLDRIDCVAHRRAVVHEYEVACLYAIQVQRWMRLPMSGRGCVMNCCMIKGLHIWKTWTLTVVEGEQVFSGLAKKVTISKKNRHFCSILMKLGQSD